MHIFIRKEVRESERQQRIAIEQLEMARARRMAMEEEVRHWQSGLAV